MRCEDLQNLIAIAGDDVLSAAERELLDAHLTVCPLCRQALDDVRNLTRELRIMRRPAMGGEVLYAMRAAVTERMGARTAFWLAEDRRPWMQAWLMPSSAGVFGTIIMVTFFLWALLLAPANPDRYDGLAAMERDSLLREYVEPRREVAFESPSINPQGALVALTNSFVRGEMSDDEVVVVAEVFGNGLARISEVVEPSRDRRAVRELEKALESDPAFAPFVPAAMDHRPQSVRVVLKIQNVNVTTSDGS